MARLSVNLNKVALLRNSRRTGVPDVLRFAELAREAGADGITVHPRPDERHIRRDDVFALAELIRPWRPQFELNLEGYPDERFLGLCSVVRPEQCTIVPDPPTAFTSEQGWKLDDNDRPIVSNAVSALKSMGCRVIVFVDPDADVGEARVGPEQFFTGFIRDLTERRTQERRMQELQSELVHVSRLTAMGEMASSLAHELNQPLSAITSYLRGAATLLKADQVDKERIREALDRSAVQALRAGDIIKRLREFVAKGETQPTLENPAILLEEAAALALVGAREQGVRVSLRCDRDLPDIVVDKVQIQQVALNLIRNAVEAMETTSRRELTVAVTRQKAIALFSVADTGTGINPEIAQHLFQPFVTSKANGMGVGLSICRTIIEAHGGRISAAPNNGVGTIFEFTLPFAELEPGHER